MRLSLDKYREYNDCNHYHRNPGGKISFKGGERLIVSGISSMMDDKRFFTSFSQSFNTDSVLGAVRNRIGRSADVLFEHVKSNDYISKGIISEGGNIRFKSKKPIRLLIDGVLYPITKIPSYIFYWGLDQLKKFRAVQIIH